MTNRTGWLSTLAIVVGVSAGMVWVAPKAYAGEPEEDEPGWSCIQQGNRVCGPTNSEGKPAACYDDGGAIVALWPCHVVVNQDGSSDVYLGD